MPSYSTCSMRIKKKGEWRSCPLAGLCVGGLVWMQRVEVQVGKNVSLQPRTGLRTPTSVGLLNHGRRGHLHTGKERRWKWGEPLPPGKEKWGGQGRLKNCPGNLRRQRNLERPEKQEPREDGKVLGLWVEEGTLMMEPQRLQWARSQERVHGTQSSIRRRQEPRSPRQQGYYHWAGHAFLSHNEIAPNGQELCTWDAPSLPFIPFSCSSLPSFQPISVLLPLSCPTSQ